jgi:hypothetical protein
MITKIGLWRGKPVEEMSREELIKALVEMAQMYTERLREGMKAT